jgi:hypothetical protein
MNSLTPFEMDLGNNNEGINPEEIELEDFNLPSLEIRERKILDKVESSRPLSINIRIQKQ